jgi:hypothetical protein
VAITNDFGFGQKELIVKITAISGFASCDVQGLTAMAPRAHVSIHHTKTACWVFLLVNPGGENARQYQQPSATPDWAELVITEMEVFPKGRYDDLTDSTTQAIKYIRDNGLLQTDDEARHEELRGGAMHRPPRPKALYPA